MHGCQVVMLQSEKVESKEHNQENAVAVGRTLPDAGQ